MGLIIVDSLSSSSSIIAENKLIQFSFSESPPYLRAFLMRLFRD